MECCLCMTARTRQCARLCARCGVNTDDEPPASYRGLWRGRSHRWMRSALGVSHVYVGMPVCVRARACAWSVCVCVCIKLILTAQRFCICEFANSLNFICNPQINTCGAFVVICWETQSSQTFESLDTTRPRLRTNKAMLCLLASALTP